MRVKLSVSRWILAAVLVAFLALSPSDTVAAETKFQARLVWGTDEMKPENPNLKEIDAKTKEKLKAVFKWKNYFEVETQIVVVGPNELKKVKMSSKCEIEIQELGKDGFEVKLFGEGKLTKKVKQVFPTGDCLVLAGDDKNSNAWLVMLCPLQK